MDKKKIGAGFAGALQKAADATKAAKLAVQDMAADAKQSREKKKADAQKAASAKELIAAAESEKGTAPEVKSIATRNALQIIYYLMAADGTVYHSEEEKFDAIDSDFRVYKVKDHSQLAIGEKIDFLSVIEIADHL